MDEWLPPTPINIGGGQLNSFCCEAVLEETTALAVELHTTLLETAGVNPQRQFA